MADFGSARRVGRIGELRRLPIVRLRTRRIISYAVFAMASRCCTSDKVGLERLDAVPKRLSLGCKQRELSRRAESEGVECPIP